MVVGSFDYCLGCYSFGILDLGSLAVENIVEHTLGLEEKAEVGCFDNLEEDSSADNFAEVKTGTLDCFVLEY
jgi:hypothetical protein